MPNQINAPETTGSVERLTLSTESARGVTPSLPGTLCSCAEIDYNE